MSKPAIRVEGLSKEYRIGTRQEAYRTFRDALVDAAAAPLNRLRSLVGRNGKAASPDERIWALEDVSFEVQPGEVVGIIGRNGAGKSTLLKVLSRITEPTTGRVEVRGRVASLLEVGTGFHAELTGRENIYLNGAILGMRRREIERKFDEIVDFAEVAKFIDTPVKRYSSGMYLRLAFAVAAHLEPEILMVDEVLAVGDASFQQKCLAKMRAVAGEGRTVLFVSHSMAAVSALCSRGVALAGGTVSMDGSVHSAINHYLNARSQHASKQLAERSDRAGNGYLRFSMTWIEDAESQPLDMCVCGQDIVIVASYVAQAHCPTGPLAVSFAIQGPMGERVTDLKNDISGHIWERFPPCGRVRCKVNRIPLAPGHYTYNVWATVGGEVVDSVEHAGTLRVEAGDFFGTGRLPGRIHGGFLLAQQWEVSDSGDAKCCA